MCMSWGDVVLYVRVMNGDSCCLSIYVSVYICLVIVASPAYILSCLRGDEFSEASSVCLACRLCV